MIRDFDLVLSRVPDAYTVRERDRMAHAAPWAYLQAWVDTVEDAHGPCPRLRESVDTFCEARAQMDLEARGMTCESVISGDADFVRVDGRDYDGFLVAARYLMPNNPTHKE